MFWGFSGWCNFDSSTARIRITEIHGKMAGPILEGCSRGRMKATLGLVPVTTCGVDLSLNLQAGRTIQTHQSVRSHHTSAG
ncbi:hypothetical protein ASPCADRAFT_204645 [Aspergillus carbonarius ITEM 5010]|uniref:Uncharacterized protein n=1 Tax=Aspergillus carbonarius (strain ITEM 5010) TaxID=602072 RepID=A0A1R3RWW7_ASPC5|nr:hypothetical protein ASPCADRAFT_204645 [Aspergillus carbonarius ITEM 5010]